MDKLQERAVVINIVKKWAHKSHFIKRLYLFGSIAQLKQNSASDIDLAIELETTMTLEKNITLFWFDNIESMQEQLSYQFRKLNIYRRLHIQLLDDDTNHIKSFVSKKSGGMLIFEVPYVI